jgi:hypothetical protein
MANEATPEICTGLPTRYYISQSISSEHPANMASPTVFVKVSLMSWLAIAFAINTCRSQDSLRQSSDHEAVHGGALWAGVDVGWHAASSGHTGFNDGVCVRLGALEVPINNWVAYSVGITQWHGAARNVNERSRDAWGVDLQLAGYLLRTEHYGLYFGPRIGMEDVDHGGGTAATIGAVLTGTYQFAENWKLRLQGAYLNGETILTFGGGVKYAFPVVSLGIAANIGK